MKYKTHKTSDTRDHFNAWQIATLGGKLSRVSFSHYRKAYTAAVRLHWLNEYADRVAEFDNNAERYIEEKSEKMNKKLIDQAERVADLLAPLGVEFCIYSHFYNIQDKKTKKEIFTRY